MDWGLVRDGAAAVAPIVAMFGIAFGCVMIRDAIGEYRRVRLAEDEESDCDRCPFDTCRGPANCWREMKL